MRVNAERVAGMRIEEFVRMYTCINKWWASGGLDLKVADAVLVIECGWRDV